MKIKKHLSLLSGALLTFAVMSLASGTAFAAGQNCTWTGLGADANFSTTGNWSGCGGTAPGNGDNLIFPGSAARQTNNNDLSGRTFANILFNGTVASGYNISGNAFTLTGGITDNSSGNAGNTIDTSITMTGDQTITGTHSSTGGVNLIIGNTLSARTLTLSSGTLTITGSPSVDIDSALAGSGNIVLTNAAVGFTRAASGFTGSTTITGTSFVTIFEDTLTALGSGHITVGSGSTLSLVSNQNAVTMPNAFTLSGTGFGTGTLGAISAGLGSCPGGTCSSSAQLTLSGSVALAANSSVSASGSRIVLSGAYTPNGFTLTAINNTTLVLPTAAATTTPKAPNTGLGAIQSNPLVTLAATTFGAVVLGAIAFRFRKSPAKR